MLEQPKCQSGIHCYLACWHIAASGRKSPHQSTVAKTLPSNFSIFQKTVRTANAFRKMLPPTRSLSPPRRSNQTATFVGPMIFVRVLGRKPLLSGHELEAMRAASLHQSESVVFQEFNVVFSNLTGKDHKWLQDCALNYSIYANHILTKGLT